MYNSSYTPPKKRGILKTFITVVITVAVTVTVMRYVPEIKANTKQNDVKRLEANVENINSETKPAVQNNVTNLIENIMPSVVGIRNTKTRWA
jgi:hypothetical protein